MLTQPREAPGRAKAAPGLARAVIFAGHPMLSVTIESPAPDSDDVHLHPAGQGVWVARMAGELGATPVLCGFLGGESGTVLRPLLSQLPGELRMVRTAGASGCYVFDRRGGERELISAAWPDTPSRHEVDELFSLTCAAALDSDVLVVCNPNPGDNLPAAIYSDLVSDVRANGTPVLVDLSTPRLDSALAGAPDLVKLNDWELAEFIRGPVRSSSELRGAAERLIERGAQAVLVTRGGEPAMALRDGKSLELVPPRFERGSREGCGDSMMGAIAASWAQGLGWERTLVLGAAAGATNFLRHGLGTGSRRVVEDLATQVELRGAPV
jgi:1-phosphofructokinase